MMILRFWAADGRHVTNRIAVVKTQSRPSFICTSEISTDVTSVLQAVAHEREFFAKVTLPLPVRWLDSSLGHSDRVVILCHSANECDAFDGTLDDPQFERTGFRILDNFRQIVPELRATSHP